MIKTDTGLSMSTCMSGYTYSLDRTEGDKFYTLTYEGSYTGLFQQNLSPNWEDFVTFRTLRDVKVKTSAPRVYNLEDFFYFREKNPNGCPNLYQHPSFVFDRMVKNNTIVFAENEPHIYEVQPRKDVVVGRFIANRTNVGAVLSSALKGMTLCIMLLLSMSAMAQNNTDMTLDTDGSFELSTTLSSKDIVWKAIKISVKEGIPARKSSSISFNITGKSLEYIVGYNEDNKVYTVTTRGQDILVTKTVAAVRSAIEVGAYTRVTGHSPNS